MDDTTDIGQSFTTGAAGPVSLTDVKLDLHNWINGNCLSGCTLRLQLWSASNTDGKPISMIYTQDLPSLTLTSEAAERPSTGSRVVAAGAGSAVAAGSRCHAPPAP